MIEISGYDVIEEVVQKSYYTLYSGIDIRTFRPVHLKYFPAETYVYLDLDSFTEEFQQLKQIRSDYLIEFIDFIPPNIKDQTGPILIHEIVSGKSLNQLIEEGPIEIIPFLRLAIQLSKAITALHQEGLFAKEIIPEQIIVCPENNEVKITHLGFRSLVLLHSKDLDHPMMINHILPYISPEHTGKVHGQPDYRSDFYVLGTILYALLIGTPPFIADNSMEIIHGHIAKKPIKPKTIRSEIPSAISDLIMKLLAKSPENRYQNAYDLQIDFQSYLVEYRQTKAIGVFPFGRNDVPETFRLPGKFYGRQSELEILTNTFQKVRTGSSQILLLTGYPGIGKSRLITEFNKEIEDVTTFFISGKYDSFAQNIPYYAIIEALRKLIDQVLLMETKEIDKLREKLLEALHPNAQLLIDLVPEIEFFIGKQPPLLELSPVETLNRFQMTCATVTSIFATQDQPVILFLDDLQWADFASLELIEKLLTDFDKHYFMFIGAYRENEVDEQHPLKRVIESIRKKRPQTPLIHIDPLPFSETQQIVADTISLDLSKTQDLAKVIFNKTHGNPFFTLQYLQSLHSDNVFTYDFETGRWQWDMDYIRFTDSSTTDNEVDFIFKRIKKLSLSTQTLLEMASCIGNHFELHLLSVLCQKDLSKITNDIKAGIDAGFISPSHTNKHFLLNKSEITINKDLPELPIDVEFVHDTVRQVFYSMIPDDRRKDYHLCIGRKLQKKFNDDKNGENVIRTVTHLNLAIPLLTNDIEKKEIASLNLLAGKQAVKSNAYATARIYFETGISLLPLNIWDTDFELMASLQKEKGLCEYLCGNFSEAEALFKNSISRMRTPMEKTDLYIELIVLYTIMNKLDDAIELGIKGAEMLGVRVPHSPHIFTLCMEFLKFRYRLGFRKIKSLIDQPPMSDKKQIAIEHLLTNLRTAARYSNPQLYLFIVLIQINAYLKYGNSVFSPIGYAAVGGIMAAILKAYRTAFAYGDLALKLADKINNEKVSCTTEYIFAWYIQHWQKPIFNNIAYYEKAHRHALKTGNLIICGHSVNMIFMTRFITGEPLLKVFSEYVKQESILLKINDSFVYENFKCNIRLFLKFLGPDKKYHHLNCESEPSQIHPLLSGNGINKIFLFHVLLNKLIGHFIYSKYNKCRQCIEEIELVAPIAKGTFQYVIYHFFRSLTLLMLYPEARPQYKFRYRMEMNRNQRRLKKYSKACPENFLPFYYLVTAEKARIENSFERSIKLYRKAIQLFRDMGYIHFEALAHEMAMKAHLSMGFEEMGRVHLTEAYALYLKWGATAKVSDLESKHGIFQTETAEKLRNSLLPILDYTTIVQTLRSISTEIRLSDLLKKLMKISVINAGAEKGFFLSKKGESFYVEAYHSSATQTPLILNSRPLLEQKDLLQPVIHHVDRTMKPLVLEDASRNEYYFTNTYVKDSNLKSVLCLPVIRQSILVGIMYFENNVIAGAFTAKHIEGLKLLASQAAISFENATLYEHVIKKRTRVAGFFCKASIFVS